MRTVAVLVTAVASVAIAVLAVDLLDDRETLVPPPEAVAEEFVRQILASRSEQAMPLVSGALRGRLSPDELDDYGRELEEELGGVGNVFAEAVPIPDNRATVSTLLDGARGTKSLWFELVCEDGQWTIVKLGESAAERRAAVAI